jgi:hypothetical protein
MTNRSFLPRLSAGSAFDLKLCTAYLMLPSGYFQSSDTLVQYRALTPTHIDP